MDDEDAPAQGGWTGGLSGRQGRERREKGWVDLSFPLSLLLRGIHTPRFAHSATLGVEDLFCLL